jgi:hypothetical protein
MKVSIRNRIKEHRRVRAGDLVAHELNWRTHPRRQREALAALYGEVGFARSLLTYELPDGRLKLIDGHLRRDFDPDMLVDVEVLDVTEAEAQKLLLSMDSLAGLAETDAAAAAQLAARCHADAPVLNELWQAVARNEAATRSRLQKAVMPPADQFMILVTCADEQDQVRLLKRFFTEGIPCRALVS